VNSCKAPLKPELQLRPASGEAVRGCNLRKGELKVSLATPTTILRLRSLTPTSQLAEQVDQSVHTETEQAGRVEHGCVLHDVVSEMLLSNPQLPPKAGWILSTRFLNI